MESRLHPTQPDTGRTVGGQKRKLPKVGFPAAQSPLMRHSITLNVRYNQPQADWDRVAEVYRSMPGWRNGSDASWFGSEGDTEWIWASVEQSGILIEAQMDEAAWSKWIGELCARLTAALGRPVHDAES